MKPAIELEHISKRYGRQYIFSDINLTVNRGKIIVLQGNNGAGKTTFLRVLSTRLSPTTGVGKIFGFDLKKKAHEVRKHVAYLTVFGGNYQNLTAFENLKFASQLYKKKLAKGDILDLLEHVQLANAKTKLVREYSSGMKKRLSLAKLMLSDAKLWLLDEPFAALDSDGKELVDNLILKAKKEGKTLIIASHDVERASKFADTVLSIDAGGLKLQKDINNG